MADEKQPIEKLIMDVSAELVRVNEGLKKTAETASADMKRIGDVSAETKAAADKLLAEQGKLDARLNDLEQKLARRGSAPEAKKSLGQQVVDNEDVKAFCAKNGRGSVKVNAMITSGSGSAGDAVAPDRLPGVVAPPDRRLTIRDLLTPGRTSSNAIQYVKETGFTNNARPVTEGAQKPESDITFDLLTKNVATIAHFVQATKQILADAPMLSSYIDGRLRYGLAYKEELQLLKGDGLGANIAGIVPQATEYNPSMVPDKLTRIDEIRLAILQAALAEYPVTGIVLNPIDWAGIELVKDDLGRYIIGNPQSIAGPVLWSRPVIETQAMDAGDFLVGAFKLGAQIFDREDASVEISTEDRDNFVKNLVTVLAEERLGLAVYRPEAFITGEFTATT